MKKVTKTMMGIAVMAGVGYGTYMYMKNNKKVMNKIKSTYEMIK